MRFSSARSPVNGLYEDYFKDSIKASSPIRSLFFGRLEPPKRTHVALNMSGFKTDLQEKLCHNFSFRWFNTGLFSAR